VTSIATAAKGFEVIGYDPDAQRCTDLTNQKLPVAEPQLPSYLRRIKRASGYRPTPVS